MTALFMTIAVILVWLCVSVLLTAFMGAVVQAQRSRDRDASTQR